MTKRTEHTVEEREAAGTREEQRKPISKQDEAVPSNREDIKGNNEGKSKPGEKSRVDEEEGRGGIMKSKDGRP